VKSDDFPLFLNDIKQIDEKWGFFIHSMQKTLDFQYYGGCRGAQSPLAIPRRFG